MNRTTVPLLLLMVAAFGGSVARGQGQNFDQLYAKAIGLYQNLDYEAALGEFDMAATLAHANAQKAQVVLMQGVVLFEMGRPDEAAQHFKKALRLDPAAKLPAEVSPKVAAEVEKARPARHESALAHDDAQVPPYPELSVREPTRPSSAVAPITPLPLPPSPDAPVRVATPTPPPPPVLKPAPLVAPADTGGALRVSARIRPTPAFTFPALWRDHRPSVILAGAGVVGLLAGTIFGINANQAKNAAAVATPSQQQNFIDRSNHDATASNVSFIAGGAALVGAVATYFLIPPSNASGMP